MSRARTVNAALVIRSLLIAAGLFVAEAAQAQEPAGRTSQYEISASWLGLTPSGSVQTNSNRVDFQSDLGIDGTQSQIGFWFLTIPWERNGLFFEFIPYRFDGEQTATRSFRFGGVTYPANEPVTAKANLNYLALGYHRTLADTPRVDAGLLAGIAYFNISAEADSPSAGPAEVDRHAPFPLAGFTVRYSPSPASRYSLRGDFRGMTFGSYGGYFDGSGAIGFNLSPNIALEAGYRWVYGNGHHETRGGNFNFRGPTITFRMFDR